MKKIFLFALVTFTMNVFAQVSKTVTITAGNLSSTLTASEKSTVTNLTILGNIDARDFKTVRDNMPLLAELDLSGVTIAEYTGTEGTDGTNSKKYPANTIPARAFYDSNTYLGKSNFKSILLPNTITAIGEWAFLNLKGLTTAFIPSSVTSIGDLAFSGTSGFINVQTENPNFSSINGVLFNKLKTTLIQCPISITGNYVIPATVTSIGDFSFDNCSKLTSITVPQSVITIGNAAFASCKGLTSVNIPSSITKIGYQAFFLCSGLNSIIIPWSVTSIDFLAFAGSTGLFTVDLNNPKYSSVDGILYNKNKTELIQCPTSKTGDYSIPGSVTSIGEYAFYTCRKLTSVTIPSSVISISERAFWYCSGLTSIYVNKNIPIDLSQSSGVFADININTCTLFVPIDTKTAYQSANQWKDFIIIFEMRAINVTAGNLKNLFTAIELASITKLTLSGTIDARDFKTMRDDMPLLAELDLSGVTIVAYKGAEGPSTWGNDYPANTIPESAFMSVNWQGKNSLTSVKLPESLNSIGQNAFYSCKGLTTISFPSLCTTIGDDTFSFCSGLTTIAIPSSVTSIGDRAFMVCSGLISVDVGNPNYSSLEGVLFDKQKTRVIGCPTSKTGAYSIPQTVSIIHDYAFYYCSDLDGTLTIPPKVSSIGFNAFSHCINLDEVNIPSSVTTIGNYALYDCGGIFNVDKSNPNYSSEDGILFNKTKTTLIQCGSSRQEYYTIPESVTTIGQSAFSRCKTLTGVKIPSSVTIIGPSAFWGCSSMLGSISIPASVLSIGNYAFSGCTGLTAIYSYTIEPVDISSSIQLFYNVNKNNCILYVPKGSVQAYQSANQWYEFNNIVEMPGFTFSSTSVRVDAVNGSKATVDITSDVAWEATSDQTWLSVNSRSGNGNGKLTFTATANPSNTIRTAKVIVSATGLESRIISVVQSYVLNPTITKLYDFDCQNPYSFSYDSRLVYDGVYLYGIMHDISFFPKQKLIRIKPDGSSFTELYSFDFDVNEDVYLSLSNNVLYGQMDGYDHDDILFKINTDGSNYTKFSVVDDQKLQLGYNSLIVANNKIYGSSDDSDGKHNLFKLNTDGSGYTVIYSSTEIDFSNIVLSGSAIIGDYYGKIIKVNIDGSGFLYYGIDSDVPVIADKDIIYGMKRAIDETEGYIFKVNINGTGFTKIKTLTYPEFGLTNIGTLAIVENTLYGITEDNSGIFKIKTDGTGFKKIQHDLQFGYYSTSVELTLVGSELFGFTSNEMISSTLFKINTTNDIFSKVFQFGTSTLGMFPMGTLTESGDYLYGNTIGGGNYNFGTIFRINKDGSGYTKLFDFKGNETGVAPTGQLTLIENTLYGTTQGYYDQIGYGCIYKINTDGTGFTKLHEFDSTTGIGPTGSLIYYKGSLYGNTNDGGINNHGVVFKFNPNNNEFTKILDYSSNSTGERSENGIIISNDVIYGVSSIDYGSVFSINIDGTGLRKIFEMNDESGDFSYCKPLMINEELYLTTSEGGENGVGTIFKIKTDGTGFTVLYNFEGIDESYGSGFRNNSLMYYEGVLYGTATGNGINDHGYLYKINLDGSGFTKLSDFNGEYGSMPYLCDLIADNNAGIFGMTTFGGNYSGGIIYKYSLNETSNTAYDLSDEVEYVQVYPNPVTNEFRISGIKGNATIKLFDINGKLLLTKEIENDEYVSISKLSSGVFILKINSEAGRIQKKLVKK